MQESGLYILVLFLEENQTIAAGRLPPNRFECGRYLYIGRSQKNLSSRWKRHLKKEKKIFWHIDYFLQKALVREVWIKSGDYDECRTALHIQEMIPGCRCAQKKFGSSDCHCDSHLLYCHKDNVDFSPSLKKFGFKEVWTHGNHL